MTLLSALDDFVLRTLAAIPNPWERLEYVASLREDGGAYQHWGLQHVFGAEAAKIAIAEAHRMLLLDLLRCPLQDLLRDATAVAQNRGITLQDYLQGLMSATNNLQPADLGGGSARHFSSVLHCLSSLAQPCKDASSPVSSPRRLLDPPPQHHGGTS